MHNSPQNQLISLILLVCLRARRENFGLGGNHSLFHPTIDGCVDKVSKVNIIKDAFLLNKKSAKTNETEKYGFIGVTLYSNSPCLFYMGCHFFRIKSDLVNVSGKLRCLGKRL